MINEWKIIGNPWKCMQNKRKPKDINKKLMKNSWFSLNCDSNLRFEIWTSTQNQLLSGERAKWMNNWMINEWKIYGNQWKCMEHQWTS